MGEKTNSHYLKLADSINLDLTEYECLVKKLLLNPDIIDLDAFKKRLEKEMSGIDCTPSKDGATFEEIQDFFKEIDNIPHKLQRNKKLKDFQKLNSTIVPKRTITREFASSANLTQITNNSTNTSNENLSTKLYSKLTPKEIFNNFNECKSRIEIILKNFGDNTKNIEYCYAEIEKIKKFIADLEIIQANYENQPNEEAFTKVEEIKLDDFVNAVEQFVFISENQNFYLETDESNIGTLKVVTDIVNDLLKNIM